jgi:DNA-directed RNA polymerase subunit RPC12/RpoP
MSKSSDYDGRGYDPPYPTDQDEIIDHDFTDAPICPNCGFKDQDWWDGLTFDVRDGSEWTAICSNCGKDYMIRACVSIEFSTRIPTIEVTEEPEENTCKNCGHERSDHYKWILHHDNDTRDTQGCAVEGCICEEFEEDEELTDKQESFTNVRP